MDSNAHEKIAEELIRLAKDTISVRYRFFAGALARINPSIDTEVLLAKFLEESGYAVRLCLHSMFHLLFMHTSVARDAGALGALACDIAVENVILEMNMQDAYLIRDDAQRLVLQDISNETGKITYDTVYNYLTNIKDDSKIHKWEELFKIDDHEWPRELSGKSDEEIILQEEDFKRLAARIKTEITSFSDGESRKALTDNLALAVRERKSYEEILARFATLREEIKVNPDEFDYVYYSYGLRTYGDMPLIEPLEYTEDKRVREFVIALDTSASISDELMREFLIRTYEILKKVGSVSTGIRIHIITCDFEVKSDDMIDSIDSFEEYVRNFSAKGYGATDFRPVFEYTHEKIQSEEYDEVAGIIYLTDGYGVYPAKSPGIETVFAFATEDENKPAVPQWAIEAYI